eukprot:31485-Pelagococcus_subviridis.AAC.4
MEMNDCRRGERKVHSRSRSLLLVALFWMPKSEPRSGRPMTHRSRGDTPIEVDPLDRPPRHSALYNVVFVLRTHARTRQYFHRSGKSEGISRAYILIAARSLPSSLRRALGTRTRGHATRRRATLEKTSRGVDAAPRARRRVRARVDTARALRLLKARASCYLEYPHSTRAGAGDDDDAAPAARDRDVPRSSQDVAGAVPAAAVARADDGDERVVRARAARRARVARLGEE